MNIAAINKYMAAVKPIEPRGVESPQQGKPTEKQSFADMFAQAVKETDVAQKDADKKVQDLVLGKSPSPHEAMIALEKADVAFQLMNQVRSKIIRAYEDIIRTQV